MFPVCYSLLAIPHCPLTIPGRAPLVSGFGSGPFLCDSSFTNKYYCVQFLVFIGFPKKGQ